MTQHDITVRAEPTDQGYRLELSGGLYGARGVMDEIVLDLAHANHTDAELVLWTGLDRQQFTDLAERVKAGEDEFDLADLHAVHAALIVATAPFMFGDEEGFHTRHGLFRETVSELAGNLARAVEEAS